MENSQTCPHCASQIDGRASVCPVCRRDIRPARRSSEGGSWARRFLLFFFIFFGVIGCCLAAIFVGLPALFLALGATGPPPPAATLSAPAWVATSQASRLINSYRNDPPAGEFCGQNGVRLVCAGDFSYESSFQSSEPPYDTVQAPAGFHFVGLAFQVTNRTGSLMTMAREHLSLALEDGRAYSAAGESRDYWGNLGQFVLLPGRRWSIGSLFLVPAGVAPVALVYAAPGEDAITLDLLAPVDEGR